MRMRVGHKISRRLDEEGAVRGGATHINYCISVRLETILACLEKAGTSHSAACNLWGLISKPRNP